MRTADAARLALDAVSDPTSAREHCRRPFAVGADAVATDWRCALLLEGWATRLGLAPMETPARLLRFLSADGARPLGVVAARDLLAWCDPHVPRGPRRLGLIGDHVYDRNLVARAAGQMPGLSGTVRAHVREWDVGPGVIAAALTLGGDGWRAAVMNVDAVGRDVPNEGTRLLLGKE